MSKVFLRSDFFQSEVLSYDYNGTSMLDLIDKHATGFGLENDVYEYVVLSTVKVADNFNEITISVSEEIPNIGEMTVLKLTGILNGEFRVKEKNRLSIKLIDVNRLVDLNDGVQRINQSGEVSLAVGGWKHLYRDNTTLVIKSPTNLYFMFIDKFLDNGFIADNSSVEFTKTLPTIKAQTTYTYNIAAQVIMLSEWDSTLSVGENYRAYAMKGDNKFSFPIVPIKPHSTNGNHVANYSGWFLSITDNSIFWAFDIGMVNAYMKNRPCGIGATYENNPFIFSGTDIKSVLLDYNNWVNSNLYHHSELYSVANYKAFYIGLNNKMVNHWERGVGYYYSGNDVHKVTFCKNISNVLVPFWFNAIDKNFCTLLNNVYNVLSAPNFNCTVKDIIQIGDKFFVGGNIGFGYENANQYLSYYTMHLLYIEI